jgi:hypothetical protein
MAEQGLDYCRGDGEGKGVAEHDVERQKSAYAIQALETSHKDNLYGYFQKIQAAGCKMLLDGIDISTGYQIRSSIPSLKEQAGSWSLLLQTDRYACCGKVQPQSLAC